MKQREEGAGIDVVKPRNENRTGQTGEHRRTMFGFFETPTRATISNLVFQFSNSLSLSLSHSRCSVNRARYLARSTIIARRCWKLIAGSIYRSLQTRYWPRTRSRSLPGWILLWFGGLISVRRNSTQKEQKKKPDWKMDRTNLSYVLS